MSKAVFQSSQAVSDDLILGQLFFYNLGEIKIDENELTALFTQNNLSHSYIRKIAKVDAFRRATSKVKRSIDINFNGSQKKAYLEVDEVKKDQDGIVRIVGRKVVDEKNEDLSYEVVGKLIYNRDTETVSSAQNTNFSHEYDYLSVLEEVKDLYSEWAQYHTKDTIRNLTNNIIKSMYPVNLMPTGLCKFIPKSQKDTLYGLRGLIRDLSTFGTGNTFEIIPVIDTEEQRELIDRSAQQDIKNELNAFVAELKDVISAKSSIPTKTAQNYVVKFKEMQDKTKEYENLIGTYMSVLHHQISQAIQFVGDNEEVISSDEV